MARASSPVWLTGDDRFIELMHALSSPEEKWTEPGCPDILTSLDELIAWANDDRDYEEHFHKSGWSSAIQDLLDAAGSLGQQTANALKPHIETLRGICHPAIGGDPSLRDQLRREASVVRESLASISTLVAAWNDLVKACGRKEATIKTVSARRDTFWAVVQAADRNTVELSRSLTDVLTGNPMHAVEAKLKLGEIDSPGGDYGYLRNLSITSARDRIDLAAKLLGYPPKSAAHVVWFAFKHARSNSTDQDLRSIRFFDAEWLHGNLFDEGPSRDRLPVELFDLNRADAFPSHRDVVMARVDLGVGAFSDAVRIARERLEALLGLATIESAVPWERMDGFIHFQDNRVVSHRYFEYEDPKIQSHHILNSTATQVSRNAPRIAPLVHMQDSNLKDIVESLHWWRTGRNRPTAASVILNVRAVELVGTRVGERYWTTFLKRYIKNLWIHDALAEALYFPLYEALHRMVPRASDAAARQRNILLEVTRYKDGRREFHLDGAASHLDTIIDLTPVNLPLGRELRSIRRRTSSAPAIQAWLKELERTWARSVHRLERVRNAIAHGGPFTERAVLLVQPFSRKVSVWSLWESIEGLLEGKPLPQAYSDLKRQWDDWRSSIQSADSIEGLLRKN